MAKPVKHYGKWRIRWIDERGERRSATYDDYKTAVFMLKKLETEAEEVRRGLRAVPVRANKTFEELAAYWLEKRVPQKRNPKDDLSIIRTHLMPSFGPMTLATIGIEAVDQFTVERQHLNPKTVSNILTLLITMLNLAVDLKWLASAPNIKKPRVRLFSEDFCYLRDDSEIRRFLNSARIEGEVEFALYATAIYTGMREGELAGLTWRDVDLGKRLITVQRSFNNPTKSGDVRYVPILDPLLPLLKEWKLRCPGQLLFPNQMGGMQLPSGRIFSEVRTRILKRAGFPRITKSGKERDYIVFHDLRHTFASHWVMNNGDIFKLQKILGHKSIQMTMRYAHLAPAAFAADHGRIGDHISFSGGKVIALSK